ncbi:hypothetical protein SUGI_0466120 [Cryptomeria japonica]|nr:hypothetical protein SUGI_0466120 [Cryptomeria japonica]
MECSKKRSRDFEIDNGFTPKEMEAADALLRLCDLGCFYVEWAGKRRRSAIASDTHITHQSKLANRNPLIDMSIKHVYRRRLPTKKVTRN